MVGNDFPHIFSSLKSNLGVYGVMDPYNSALVNNGALNPPGSTFFIPSPAQSQGLTSVLQTASGYGSGLWVRYVLYKSTANPAVVTGPAPVYYTDETLTTVSGVSTESLGGVNMVAGWMLPNSNTTSATGSGSAFTATLLNNGGNGSYVFIGLLGFIPGAISATSTVAGDALIGAATNFTVARVAAGTAPTNKVLGWAMASVSGGLGDVMAYISPF